MVEDPERCYRAVRSRDARFDGWFVFGVTSTGIYCRPSCPAVPPRRENMRFYATAAAAQLVGFRACLRCRPDAAPGSPEWNARADVAGRAMRLIADGVVDREGVGGLARRLGYSERHLNRQLTHELGAGPLALARAQRAQAARILIETTGLPFAQVAYAAGFRSLRQFNATVHEAYANTPTQLRARARARGPAPGGPGGLELRLPVRRPFHGERLMAFLAARAIPGVEEADGERYRRSLRLPHGAGVVEVRPAGEGVRCRLSLDDLRDLATAVERCRRLLDLDADPQAVDALLGGDPALGPLVGASPGLRVPGAVDGAELALRAVLGQQVSLAGARVLAARLAEQLGEPLSQPDGGVTRLFPGPQAIAAAGDLPMPRARAGALRGLAAALAAGALVVDPGEDREAVRRGLLALPGVGPWTASYVAMRGLADPDVMLQGDAGVRRGLAALGLGDGAWAAERWRPWRSYAVQHLWAAGTVHPDGPRAGGVPAQA